MLPGKPMSISPGYALALPRRGCGRTASPAICRVEAMMTMKFNRIALASCVALLVCFDALGARAEPLLTQGIGTSNCARLSGDLKPAEGLGNPVNLMAYAWAQGYISAANISMVEADSKHVDMGQLDESKILGLLVAYCKANPDKQPLGALNEYLRKSPKVHIKWEKGTVDWNQ
jgi:hypothetical protein